MFVLLFRYVFGGAIQIAGFDYVDFLLPGIFVQTVTFGAVGTAIGLAEDMSKGLIERFRSLPRRLRRIRRIPIASLSCLISSSAFGLVGSEAVDLRSVW